MIGKLGRNDPCWCGSGKKYKNCHLNRESEQPRPVEAISAAWRRAWEHKKCLHHQAKKGVCDNIISSHTIQRARVLEKLVDAENHVMTFYRSNFDDSGKPVLCRVGWKQAATFTGFCAKHDNETFASIEDMPFNSTIEQSFLVGYRALCHEIYQKHGVLRALPVIRSMIDRGKTPDEQRQIQHRYAVMQAGSEKGLSAFESLKAIMDQYLLNNDFNSWSNTVITFKGDLCVASTGAVSPNRDFSGRILQTLHDPNTPQETLLFGIVPISSGGACVMTWLNSEKAPRDFVNSLLKSNEENLPNVLVQFMFAFVENTYFSEKWWKTLSFGMQNHIESLATMGNPYYEDFHYSYSTIIPWEVTDIKCDI